MAEAKFSGFNADKVYQALSSIETAYGDLHGSIKNKLQDGFIVGMRDKWACNEAQTFFRDIVKPQFEEIIRKVNENFTIIDEGINEAARIWALETRSDYTKRNLSMIVTKIDISMIQENISGTRGIDKTEALNLVSKLKEFEGESTSALTKAQNAIRGCGLLGGLQEDNLYNVLGKNKTIIGDYITAITNALDKAISTTVNAYGDTEGKIAQAFNIQ